MKASELYGRQNRAIHAGMCQLGLAYNDNRELWAGVMAEIARRPVTGLSGLTLGERDRLIEHLRSRGAKISRPFVPLGLAGWQKGHKDTFVPAGGRVSRPATVAKDRKLLINKINALLVSMGRDWSYADGIARQMGFGVSRTEWCSKDQLYRIVQALAVHQQRQRRKAKEAL